MKISFIGYGNIAKAIAKNISKNPNFTLKAAAPSLPIAINEDKIATHPDNSAVIKDADIIILAVKPFDAKEVLMQMKQDIPPHCLLISVVAGLNVAWLEQHCPHKQAIVRAMPNTSVAFGAGATALYANQYLTKSQKKNTEELFNNSGLVAWLDKEDEIEIITALSGSGPAYVFLFMEAMVKAAAQLGLPEGLAKTFGLQTLIGATALACESGLGLEELRKKITSSKGTTAAALQVFEKEHLEQIVFKALNAAYERAKELCVRG
jgi:pyrroline-5-carboxylate reductase